VSGLRASDLSYIASEAALLLTLLLVEDQQERLLTRAEELPPSIRLLYMCVYIFEYLGAPAVHVPPHTYIHTYIHMYMYV
jgi:hypothetical protein